MTDAQKSKIDSAALSLRVANSKREKAWDAKVKAVDEFELADREAKLTAVRYNSVCNELVESKF